MKVRHKHKPREQLKIANDRIKTLFEQAFQQFRKDPSLSNRYVEIARKIAMKYRTTISSALKRQFCKKCHSYLLAPYNVRIRAHQGKLVYRCMECNHTMRFGYKQR